jgi:hypothetical protein
MDVLFPLSKRTEPTESTCNAIRIRLTVGYVLCSQAPGLVLCTEKHSDAGQGVPASLAFALCFLLQPFNLFGVDRFEG